jgi:hypothetical protein
MSTTSQKKENFLRRYRDDINNQMKTLSAAEFIEILNHYDADGNNLLRDFDSSFQYLEI